MYDPTVRECPRDDDLGMDRELVVQGVATGVTSAADRRVYDAFGNLKSEINAHMDCLFGSTGRPADAATGMQSNLNRWYDAKVGRWLDEDPLGLEAGDANVERYCENNPTTAKDPVGLDIGDSISKEIDDYAEKLKEKLKAKVRKQLDALIFDKLRKSITTSRLPSDAKTILKVQLDAKEDEMVGKLVDQYLNEAKAKLRASLNAMGQNAKDFLRKSGLNLDRDNFDVDLHADLDDITIHRILAGLSQVDVALAGVTISGTLSSGRAEIPFTIHIPKKTVPKPVDGSEVNREDKPYIQFEFQGVLPPAWRRNGTVKLKLFGNGVEVLFEVTY